MIHNEQLTQLAGITMHPAPILITGGAAIAALVWLNQREQQHADCKPPARRFCNEDITQHFVASIPEITRELNLELATATQTETFTRSSHRTLFWGWIDLGTNTAQIQVPVTYRYHIQLRDPWKLETHDHMVIVHTPVLRASLPPATHTDQIRRISVRGWGRISAAELQDQLEKGITPTLVAYATDVRHLNLVRGQCRQSVAEFVRLWLDREGQWGRNSFTQIRVKFAGEAALPPAPTLTLLRKE